MNTELAEALRQLNEAHLTIAAIVAQAGGEIRLGQRTLLDVNPSDKLFTFDDLGTGEKVIRVERAP